MTITTIPSSPRTAGPYTATAAQTEFSYGFPIYANTDIDVWRERGGVRTLLTLTTHYTVSGVGEQNGGTVTLVEGAEEGDLITIDGDLDKERTSSYSGGQPFKQRFIDADFNRIMVMLQELQREALRSVRRAPTDELTGELILPSNVIANTLLAIDATGKIIGLLQKDFFQGVEGAGVGSSEELGSVTDGHVPVYDGASGLLLRSAGFAPRSASAAIPIGDLAHIATERFLGRVTAETGVVEVLTPAQALALLATQDPFLGTSGGLIRSAMPVVHGLVIQNNSGVPTTAIDVDATGAILVNSSGVGIRTGAIDVTINATTTGANGLDTGSLGNNTRYYVHLIHNGTTVAGLLSTSQTAPTMPSGYTYGYCVGMVQTGGSATFLTSLQVGNHASVARPTTSGTAHDLLLPPALAEVKVLLDGVQRSGDNDLYVQIGDSGGIETSSYTSGSGTRSAGTTSTSAWHINTNEEGGPWIGIMHLERLAGHRWISSHSIGGLANGICTFGGGAKTLSAELDRVRLTRSGTNTFNAGQFGAIYRDRVNAI